MITRKQYMEDASNLHYEYYLQFVTEATFRFVKEVITMEKLRASKDVHLNDLPFRHTAKGWIWDNSPMNVSLYRTLGGCSERVLPSQASHTCVGKAAARYLLEAEGSKLWL